MSVTVLVNGCLIGWICTILKMQSKKQFFFMLEMFSTSSYSFSLFLNIFLLRTVVIMFTEHIYVL